MKKGTISVRIAQVFITLQILFILGGLCAGPSPGRGINVAFHNVPAAVESVTFLFSVNILGVGALILSLIAWKHHKNIRGKDTGIVAIVVIVANTLLAILY